MTSELQQGTNYSSIKQDSELQLKLIYKYVKVHILRNCSQIGFVHSFDPVTHSIILLVPQEDNYKTSIIPGHAILDITEEVALADIKPPKRTQTLVDSKEELSKRRKKLMAWFESNLLPVTELDDKIIIGNVTLLPPYNSLDVCTDNPIVALHVKKVLERMPADFGL